jgi:hypothetical protein
MNPLAGQANADDTATLGGLIGDKLLLSKPPPPIRP